MNLQIQIAQLSAELDTLASFSEAPAPAVTRVVFSETDRQAREYVKRLCSDAGLAIREDAVGNTFARWAGDEPDLAAVATGSHIDAIPNAGRYDGTVGVLGGLEAIRALQRSGFRARRSIELVIFTSEEPTRFGVGCIGSRLMAGLLDAAADTHLVGKDGESLNHWRTAAGFGGGLAGVRLAQGHYAAFVELHIEQGPLLERAGIPLGVVTAIAAPASLRVRIEGEGGHAGAVLMPARKDAFCAAAELVLAVESAAKSTGVIDTVATVGVCEVFPGAINSIPSEVRLEVDVRDTNEARRDGVLAQIRGACADVAKRRGVAVKAETINADTPAQCDARVVESLTRACATHGFGFQTMVSRAYHDSLFMSRIAPTAMLFIPCRGGVSHRPDEYASAEAIACGVQALAATLADLASDSRENRT
jgi:ureidoglycolate amidohydrolase